MSDIPTIESRADEVIFYEDRARVIRRASASLTAGVNRLHVSGLSLLVDDSSLTLDVPDGVRLLTSKIRRNVNQVPNATREEIEELEARERRAVGEKNRLEAQVARVQRQQKRLLNLEKTYLWDLQNLNCDADVESALAVYDDPVMQSVDQHLVLDPKFREARRERERASKLLSSARTKHPEFSASIDLQFEVEEDMEIEFEFSYQVPCALWRPSHLARLDRRESRVIFHNSATVWQLTGEVWRDVRCRFSTARPARASSPPLLSDDVISARTKDRDERKEVNVEAREVDIKDTGADGARAIDEMPGVDDGGEPLTLEALERVTIPSNGEPFRIDVGHQEFDAEIELVAFPQRAPVPHVRARGTWTAPYPLLAGPVLLMRENVFAGRALANFVASGDTFELGFGTESTVSVKRQEDTDHETTRLTGRNNVKREVRLYLSNLGGDAIKLKVIERTPVSEIEDVEIKDFEGASPDKDGFCEFEIELEGKETRRHEFSYLVTYASNVNLRL